MCSHIRSCHCSRRRCCRRRCRCRRRRRCRIIRVMCIFIYFVISTLSKYKVSFYCYAGRAHLIHGFVAVVHPNVKFGFFNSRHTYYVRKISNSQTHPTDPIWSYRCVYIGISECSISADRIVLNANANHLYLSACI